MGLYRSNEVALGEFNRVMLAFPRLGELFRMQLDVIHYAKQGRSIDKTICARHITQLDGLIVENDHSIHINLTFSVGSHGLPEVKGRVYGDLELICQRCMQPMAFVLDARIELVLVHQDQHNTLKRPFDTGAFLYNTPSVSLFDLVSDDIILSLPLSARHESQCASVQTPSVGFSGQARTLPTQEAQPDNPFSVLKEMISKGTPLFPDHVHKVNVGVNNIPRRGAVTPSLRS